MYLFKHTHEGDYMENIIFIYSMPGYVCSIKERMLYSSCKGSLLEAIELLGVKVDKKVYLDSKKIIKLQIEHIEVFKFVTLILF